MAAHAQEMDPDVTRRHIALYVNDYTRALDGQAVYRLVQWAEAEGVFPAADSTLPLFLA